MKPSEYQLLVVSPFPPNGLLRDTFTHVNSVANVKEALVQLETRQQQDLTKPPILILIDMENEQQNIVALKLLIYHLRQGTVGHFIPLVCCSNDSSDYMLTCIYHGAADYLLKPLSQNVIQTMFLAAHRYSPPQRLLPSPTSSSSTASLKSEWPQIIKSGQECYDHYHQLGNIFKHHDWIYQTAIDFYSNPEQPKKVFNLDSLSRDRKVELENKLGDWGFNPFDLTDTDLIYCAVWIFDQVFKLPDMASYHLSSADFICDLWNGYHATNPYHNFYHAVDVLQSMYYVISRMGFFQQQPPSSSTMRITPIDIFALFLICIGHDIGHPGVTNSFMINTSTSLSLLFNDVSVLESYHAMLLYRLIKSHWAAALGGQLETVVRKRVVKGVLATDMALHQEYMTKLTNIQKSSLTDEDEQILLYAALIKCADISNIARPFSVAKTWANRLVEELQCQAKLEAELDLSSCLDCFGLPLDSKGQLPLAAFQHQFITKVGVGLFDAVGEFIPELKEWAQMARQNADKWTLRQTII